MQVEESEQAAEMIDQHREASMDAAIVRIMKGEKTLTVQNLVTLTIEAVAKHFKPEVRDIKQRIESLVEREFLERKDGSSHILVYLA